jgi:trehalose-6-phosphate synthase
MFDHEYQRWYELGTLSHSYEEFQLMKQVAYEYISTQAERHGSLILSEFAGAAQSLAGSLIITLVSFPNL